LRPWPGLLERLWYVAPFLLVALMSFFKLAPVDPSHSNTIACGLALWLLLWAGNSGRADLLVNGNFESGNTGFTTGYNFSNGTGIGTQRVYDILTNPYPAHPSAASYGDHTTGTGLMMAVNESTTPNVLVWAETVAVVPNSDYVFLAFISSWVSAAPSQLDVRFNGASIGTISAPATTAVWVPFSANWNSGSATSATIELRNLTNADVGGDFALDDIILTGPEPAAVPEPSMLILAIAGFVGLLSWGWRR
jgi:hypothetical protein